MSKSKAGDGKGTYFNEINCSDWLDRAEEDGRRMLTYHLSSYIVLQCYTLSHPETCRVLVTVLWAVGLWRVQSSVPSIIMIIPFTHPFPNSLPLRVSCFQTSLCFMFPFYFAFLFPLVLFPFPEPWPWYMPDSCYPDMILFDTYMFQTSCMFLSLKSTLIVPRTPRLNLWTLVCSLSKIRGQ